MFKIVFRVVSICLFIILIQSCSKKNNEQKLEQLVVSSLDSSEKQDSIISVQGNVSLNQMLSSPMSVLLTGLPDHRLVTIYRLKKDGYPAGGSYRSYSSSYDDDASETYHFMPGIDLLYGYHLLNLAHYDLKSEKTNILFDHPVLIKTLYYPSFEQDSLDKKPINRDYFLISVYDEDTNKDTLINKKDLRSFYHFNASCTVRTRIIPKDYSAVRSQYDSKNDYMYIFARHDANKNGMLETGEPMHIFWINLKAPLEGKRLY